MLPVMRSLCPYTSVVCGRRIDPSLAAQGKGRERLQSGIDRLLARMMRKVTA